MKCAVSSCSGGCATPSRALAAAAAVRVACTLHNIETHNKSGLHINLSVIACLPAYLMIFTVCLHTTSNKISPIWPLTTLNIVLCVVYAATVIASLMYLPDALLAYDY